MSPKVWLVTGANRGLGFKIAEAAVAAGHTVIGTYRSNKKPLPSISHSNNNASGSLSWIQLDVGSGDAVSKITEAGKKHGKIDVLVNNAAYGIAGTVEDTGIEIAMDMFQVNLFGTVRAIQAAVPFMRVQGSGTIVNIGSMNGTIGLPGIAYYSASKHALAGMTEALQGELAAFGIRVLLVEPGALATDFTSTQDAAVEVPIGSAYKGTFIEQVMQGFLDVEGYKGQAGSAEKAALRTVEAVDGTGMLAGRPVNLRLPLGGTGPAMAKKGRELTEIAEAYKDVYESI